MQKKTLLSACIALALSGQGWAADPGDAEGVASERKGSRISCPTNPDQLSPEQLKTLPSECSDTHDNKLFSWIAVGATALFTTFAATELNNNDGHHAHTSDTPPSPPDDDNGDDIPDGGGVTPVKNVPVTFNNAVIWDKDAGTLQIRNATFTYAENPDGSYTLTSKDGRTTIVQSWQVHESTNTVVFTGKNAGGDLLWSYDDTGQIIVTKLNGVVVDGERGSHITINDATIIDQGGNTALNGGTVLRVDGNNIVLNNEGKTVAIGEGSIVGILTGDNITINNDGDTVVAGGTAVIVNGDNASLYNIGDADVSAGGTGSVINGDGAYVVNQGNMTIDGENSIGSKIVGDDATVKQSGDLYVSGGARGIEIAGDRMKLGNTGNITVVNTNSIGVAIEGNDAIFANVGNINVSDSAVGVSVTGNSGRLSLAGDVLVGDFSTGLNITGNNNSVTLATNELNVTGQQATGVNLTGDGNTVDITGNILVDKDQKTDNAVDYFFAPSTGVSVQGDNNNLTLDGSLTVIADSELTTHTYSEIDGSQENISGIIISGDNNNINITGGIHLVGEEAQLSDGSIPASQRTSFGQTPLIGVDGHSSVYLDGDSSVSGAFPVGYYNIINLSHGASLEIGGHATFSSQDVDVYNHYFMDTPAIIAVQSGSLLKNEGSVSVQNIGFVEVRDRNSIAINNGDITLLQYDYSTPASSSQEPGASVFFSEDNSSAINNGIITAKVMDQYSVTNMISSENISYDFVFNNHVLSMTGMTAGNSGSVYNDSTGLIDMYGRGNVGMLAISNSTASNAGQIKLDTLWVDAEDTTQRQGNLRSNTAIDYGVGMATGSDTYSGPGMNATAINQQSGSITIYNAGAGMAAYGYGNTVINQGEINLEKNENYDDSIGQNKLVGMAVYDSGTAINDRTGIININAEAGQAFYNDGTGFIINYGTICTFGTCQNSSDYVDPNHAISDVLSDGDILSHDKQTVSLTNSTLIEGEVTNAGKVSNGFIMIDNGGELKNQTTGTINTNIKINSGGVLTNDGTLNTVEMTGGTFNNNGTLNSTVTLDQSSDAVLNNTGSLSTLQLKDGTVNNSGISTARVNAQGDAVFNNLVGGEARKGAILYNSAVINNEGTWKLGYQNEGNNAGTLDIDDQSVFNNRGSLILDNSKNAIRFQGANADATLYNTGEMRLDTAMGNGAIHYDSGASQFINNGQVDAKVTIAVSTADATEDNAFFWNQENGVINFDHDGTSAVTFTHNNFVAQNDGTMNVSGNNAVAMEGDKNAQLVNNGTLNLGTEGTADSGMVGMQLNANATADAVIENNGTINIFANDSFAFSVLGTEGHVVNNGTVVIADGVTGSGLIKQGNGVNVEGVNGNNGNNTEVHYGDYALPDVPNTATASAASDNHLANSGMNNLSGYVVGTNPDGSAGTLMVNNASMYGVGINTGFAAGTADTTVTFDNVVKGSNLSNADAITSTSIVWTATGSTDASGNVDVTMSKKAYTDVATDSSVNDVAKALDAGYTNNELYTSLNVGTTAELNSALKQISGSQATTVFREARVLSNRFSMLADAAPKMGNDLAFNVVAKGDPRAELDNNAEYDMMALRKTLNLSEHQTMSLEYGIARLDGKGAQNAGDNGVTGGYSQFFGLKHQLAFENGMSWNNALRYDIHQLDSSRSVAYGDVSKTADTSVKQQYLELRSEGGKTFELHEGVNMTPYAGVKLRHTLEGSYQERNAGDFNLNMNSGSETAVDSIVGLKLNYAGKDGWSANATLEGGPNLSYSKSQRTASLAGAGNHHFNVDDGQKGSGINSLASVGVKFGSKERSLVLDAYHWKEDGISDKGVMLSVKKTF